MTTKDNGYFELFLPVFKQGDDLRHHLAQHPDEPAKALLGLAAQYDAAADICRRVAGVVAEAPKDSVQINADTHHIGLEGPSSIFAGLVADEVLTVPDWEDEDGEDSDECEVFDDE